MWQIKKLCSSVVVVDVVLVVGVVVVLVIVYNEDYKRLMNHTIYQVPLTFRLLTIINSIHKVLLAFSILSSPFNIFPFSYLSVCAI